MRKNFLLQFLSFLLGQKGGDPPIDIKEVIATREGILLLVVSRSVSYNTFLHPRAKLNWK